MIDIAFLVFIVLITIFTPKGINKNINMVLSAKFMLFVALHYLTVRLGFTDGYWVDEYRAGLGLVFAWLFYLVGGFYLSFICLSTVVFHIYNVFYPANYTEVIIGFQILQLSVALWGMIDGLVDKCSPDNTCNRTHRHGH